MSAILALALSVVCTIKTDYCFEPPVTPEPPECAYRGTHEDFSLCGQKLAPPPDWLFFNVDRWEPLIERWGPDFPDVSVALVKAIIAQESQGLNGLVSSDGYASVGLMQIIPRSWTGTPTQLADPAYNIFKGMSIIAHTLIQMEGDTLMALALYNCGDGALELAWNPMRCGSHGGLFYAHKVLFYYCPLFDDTGEGCQYETNGVKLQAALDMLHVLEATSGRNWRMVRTVRPGPTPIPRLIE